MTLLTHSVSRDGGRPSNQDSCGHEAAGPFHCWVIADGLGGHRGGDVASRIAVDTILESFRSEPGMSPDHLTRWLELANAALDREQRARPETAGMRTTIVVLVSDSAHAVWAHIGDSRLYHFRNGTVHCQTKDHSVPQAMAAAGEITAGEIRFHEDRNRLLRTLGDVNRFRPALSDTPEPLQPGDAFLLCTDGFWELVTEAEMEDDLRQSNTPSEWLSRMEQRLGKQLRGGDDNYSATSVFVSDSGEEV